jgi:hypothetical protein
MPEKLFGVADRALGKTFDIKGQAGKDCRSNKKRR